MSFPIDVGVPLGSHDPADDVTPMRTNYANIKNFLTVDHIAPGAPNDGRHKKTSFAAYDTTMAPPVPAPTNPASVIYPNNQAVGFGGAVTTSVTNRAQAIFRNESGVYPLSCLKAMGYITNNGGVINTGFNISSISNPSTGVYVITLVAGTLTASLNAGVIVSTQYSSFNTKPVWSNYAITGVDQVTLSFREVNGGFTGTDPVAPTSFTFGVFQF